MDKTVRCSGKKSGESLPETLAGRSDGGAVQGGGELFFRLRQSAGFGLQVDIEVGLHLVLHHRPNHREQDRRVTEDERERLSAGAEQCKLAVGDGGEVGVVDPPGSQEV